MPYTESNYENAIIQQMQELDYDYVYGPDVERDYGDPLYSDVLDASIRRVNPDVCEAAITEALYKLRNIENGPLAFRNAIKQAADAAQGDFTAELEKSLAILAEKKERTND